MQQIDLVPLTEEEKIACLPEQEISGEVLIEKYAKGEETTVEAVRRRVAAALAAVAGLPGVHIEPEAVHFTAAPAARHRRRPAHPGAHADA